MFHFLSLAPSHPYLPGSPSLESGSQARISQRPVTQEELLSFSVLIQAWIRQHYLEVLGFVYSDDKRAEVGLSFWFSFWFSACFLLVHSFTVPGQESGHRSSVHINDNTVLQQFLRSRIHFQANDWPCVRKGYNLWDRNGFSSQARAEGGFLCDLMKNRDLALELPRCRLGSALPGIFFQTALWGRESPWHFKKLPQKALVSTTWRVCWEWAALPVPPAKKNSIAATGQYPQVSTSYCFYTLTRKVKYQKSWGHWIPFLHQNPFSVQIR